jgi:prepilin-type N-terminal cleavage/methylation domain-containing protein
MNGLREKFRNKKGFTLVEMLIVVAIIAILIAVSIPMIGTALEGAREATDAANLRSAQGAGVIMYMTADPAITARTEYWYKVNGDNAAGSLVLKTGTKPDPYGQGTAAGSDPASHVGKCIEVVIDPTLKDPEQAVTAQWEGSTP